MRGGSGVTVAASPEPPRPSPASGSAGAGASLSRRSGRWGDLGKRVGSAVILAPLALACLWFGQAPWALLIALGAAGCAAEWGAMCGANPKEWPVIVLPLGLAAVPVLAFVAGGGWALLLSGCLTLLGWVLFGRNRAAVWLTAGFVYMAPAAVALVELRHIHLVGRMDMLFLVLIIWASDIGAYVVGRLIGGPRLAPAISPGKTWSGALGGLVAAGLVGLAVAAAAGGDVAALHAVEIAMVLGAASQIGDLLESWFKRHFGVKDSGRSIPGHGGLLDRLDGMLTAAPAAWLMAAAIGGGVLLWQ